MKRMTFGLMALLLGQSLAAPTPIRIAVFYDAGTIQDGGFNQLAYNGAHRAQADLGAQVTDFDAEKRRLKSEAEQAAEIIRLSASNDLVFGVGYNNNAKITAAANANPKVKFGLIDDVSPNTSNVASILFREEEGAFLVGYLAAMNSSTGVIGFVGGMDIPLIYRFAAGYKAGAKAFNPNIKIFSQYVGSTPDAWNDPKTARVRTAALQARGADIIFAAAGASGLGVIDYIKERPCLKAANLPSGVKFTSDNFAGIPKSADYKAKCAGNTRPAFFIGVDANQNSLGDYDNDSRTLNHGLTSMLKRVDNAVFAIIQSVQDGSFKGGEVRFGLREGGVGYAKDKYNDALLTPEMIRKVDLMKTRIIRGMVKVPVK